MAAPLSADDRLAIIELMAKYAWAIDTGDVEAYVACFTPDALLSMRGVPQRGHEEIRRYVTGVVTRPDFPGRQHHHEQLIFDGDTERCTVKCYSTITQRFPEGDTRIMFAGLYRDAFVKAAAGWLFEERHWDVWDASKLESYRA